MGFTLIKYYDTNCDRCGNWASGDVGMLRGTKVNVEKKLLSLGWRVVKGETLCNFCLEGKDRPRERSYNN
ncbi:hypothetical protein BRE01_62990 [Brevibacillus reuszeri]|uniref:Uncharacterized protein n=1 Tax=Brevibacillus reuszeri TaxID=54915 RepID=A0ABQ0TYW1_9BACL|nr:hypothetical protein BRE01_62990 [Brevibacillus reuszeri]